MVLLVSAEVYHEKMVFTNVYSLRRRCFFLSGILSQAKQCQSTLRIGLLLSNEHSGHSLAIPSISKDSHPPGWRHD
jgi:hypothetical protein